MAGNAEQYAEALEKWDGLHRDRDRRSLSPELGGVAILCSTAGPRSSSEKPDLAGLQEAEIFLREAVQISEQAKATGNEVRIFVDARAEDFADVLSDTRYSDVVTIGHGSLGTFWVKGLDTPELLDWQDVALYADHLKTGSFVQRHCGNISRYLSVPFGMFCMTEHSSVIAPVGCSFEPEGLDDPINELLVQVTDEVRLTYKDIVETFRYKPDE